MSLTKSPQACHQGLTSPQGLSIYSLGLRAFLLSLLIFISGREQSCKEGGRGRKWEDLSAGELPSTHSPSLPALLPPPPFHHRPKDEGTRRTELGSIIVQLHTTYKLRWPQDIKMLSITMTTVLSYWILRCCQYCSDDACVIIQDIKMMSIVMTPVLSYWILRCCHLWWRLCYHTGY